MTYRDIQKDINKYMENDSFADFLGVSIEIIEPGHSRVSITVTDKMTNAHGITHGGLVFTLGDIAFGAASNSHGQASVALDVNICFLKASKSGDRLVAEAKEQHMGRKTALYDIIVVEEKSGELIARSQGLAYRKKA